LYKQEGTNEYINGDKHITNKYFSSMLDASMPDASMPLDQVHGLLHDDKTPWRAL
jgi:hypothetical protein